MPIMKVVKTIPRLRKASDYQMEHPYPAGMRSWSKEAIAGRVGLKAARGATKGLGEALKKTKKKMFGGVKIM